MQNLDLLGLLGREALQIPEISNFEGQRVVVTGAGGSIGSAIVKRLAGKIDFVGMIGHSEAPIFKLNLELAGCQGIDFEICDATTHPHEWLEKWQPDVVIHAAAHKHVGLMEHSPQAAFMNNTAGTMRIAGASFAAGVKRFVFISTDKAARPTSVMGASKRLAEAWCLTRAPFASVCRFGNVAGSSGSLIEIVRDKILAGQDLSLTSEDMQRYFITPDEAVDLALASSIRPGLYTLDMGKQIRIRDIMERMMAQMGKTVGINVTNPVSGEKLDEDMFNPGETPYSKNSASDLIYVQADLNTRMVALAYAGVLSGKMTLVEAANSL